MFKLKLILCFQLLIHWSVFESSNALVGKKIQPAGDHEFPFVVSIGMKSINGHPGHYHYCTGALISREHVLTAAHCLEDNLLHEIQVSVGSANFEDGKKYDVDFMVTFKAWAQNHKKRIKFIDNDVGILRLNEEVDDPWASPAVPVYRKACWLYGQDAMTAGWGVSNTGEIPVHMEKAELHVINYTTCMDRVKEIVGKRIIISENCLCTLTNADALIQCGDSGGPLFIGNEIIAVNGATLPGDKDDNDPDVQNMHVQLYYYQEFIEYMLNYPHI